ncbi:class I SAM-dependent methyltransferase [Mastigocoleus testarum]|uniref:Transcriptional regulator n=1 Tax=Mastigocoleus testarum BC008 TaxID=371196 RepID=A0A0V7ZTU5_9CYAN|nr:class I SAM-dependent methyltransferase [Mastigocoleus testarum]KST68069.1 transcriptional regulator [Mastigocoleus testarum BC008]
MVAQILSESKTEAFAGRMLDILNNSAIALMISVGHRTKLFDVLAELEPSTTQEIADAANLSERYVREWLGAMVTGNIVEYFPENSTYFLPREYAILLTRDAGADNIAVLTQYISILGAVEDQIVECFRQGGGVPYSAYKRFHEVMADDSGQSVVSSLDSILGLVPGLTEKLRNGADVLDVGCGSGRALNKLAQIFPASRFCGYDISAEAITRARNEAQGLSLGNISFQVKDVATLNENSRYDLICTFDAIHDQAKPDVVLRGIFQALRPNGVYLMQDICASSDIAGNLNHPIAPLLYTISCMHCMTVSLAMNGMGLGAMWGEEKALEMLQDAGFSSVEIKQLEHDLQNSYYIVRK